MLLPILAGKMSPPFVRRSGSETLLRIRSLAGSIIDTLESSFQKGQLDMPIGDIVNVLEAWEAAK